MTAARIIGRRSASGVARSWSSTAARRTQCRICGRVVCARPGIAGGSASARPNKPRFSSRAVHAAHDPEPVPTSLRAERRYRVDEIGLRSVHRPSDVAKGPSVAHVGALRFKFIARVCE
jgi:hypothetical protein